MEQTNLPTLYLLPKPRFCSAEELKLCTSYRDAVRWSWEMRANKRMTKRSAAELCGTYAPHVTDYLHPDDAPSRRNLPMDRVADWCRVVGNYLVLQYVNRQAELTIMEEIIAQRQAA